MEKYNQYLNNPMYKFVSYSQNKFKLGGKILTNYDGFTHDDPNPDNVNQGIPISNNATVEKDETSFNLADGGKGVFTNSIALPGTKKTFASESKKIASKYSKRDKSDDVLAKNAQLREYNELFKFQEAVKESMKTPQQRMQEQMQQQMAMQQQAQQPQQEQPIQPQMAKYGGNVVPSVNNGYMPLNNLYEGGGYLNTLFKNGGVKMVTPTAVDIIDNSPLTSEVTFGDMIPYTPQPIIKPRGVYGNAAPLQRGTTPEYKQSMVHAAIKANTPTPQTGYKPAYGVPMAGYAAQALSNLPALFAKPAKVNYDRITPETVDLSSQRDEARRNRNLQLSMAQRQAGQMDNAGQAGAYANAATSGIMENYGNTYNQSRMAQDTTNVGIKNQAKAQNAQIQMAEQNARQQEADAIRSGKQQAIANIGTTAAMAGKNYGQMGQEANMMDWLGISNPDYTITYDAKGNPIISRKKSKYGGKIGRKV